MKQNNFLKFAEWHLHLGMSYNLAIIKIKNSVNKNLNKKDIENVQKKKKKKKKRKKEITDRNQKTKSVSFL